MPPKGSRKYPVKTVSSKTKALIYGIMGKRRARRRANKIYRPLAGFNNRNGFPEKMHIQLRYCDIYDINSAITPGVQSWVLNSIFDPDNTSTGHQPMFRDNLASLYTYYQVTKVKATLKFVNDQVSTFITLRPTNEPGIPTNISLEGERPFGTSVTTSPGTHTIVKRTYNIPKILGISPVTYARDDQFYTRFTSNPIGQWQALLDLTVIAADQSTSTQTHVWVEFVMYVSCFDLIQNQSQN